MFRFHGFTLIELLVVIAIILILIGIALPNFLNAQISAKVTHVMETHNSLNAAIQSYQTDFKTYPLSWSKHPATMPMRFPEDGYVRWRLVCLTAPISYMRVLPESPFFPDKQKHSDGVIELKYNAGSSYDQAKGWYNNLGPMLAKSSKWSTEYHLRDAGPDKVWNNQDWYNVTNLMPYSPTNGIGSIGDIWKFGP